MRERHERTTVSGGTGGVGFFGVLGIVFIVLKLCGVINWSWWLVLLPIYGPAMVVIIIVFAMFVAIGTTPRIKK